MNGNKFTYPDIIGYTLADATNILKEYGIEITEIKTTAPPRKVADAFDGNFRVLKIIAVDSSRVSLLLCKPMDN